MVVGERDASAGTGRFASCLTRLISCAGNAVLGSRHQPPSYLNSIGAIGHLAWNQTAEGRIGIGNSPWGEVTLKARRGSLVIVSVRTYPPPEGGREWSSEVANRLTERFPNVVLSGWKIFGDDVKITTQDDPDEWTIGLDRTGRMPEGEFREQAVALVRFLFLEEP